MKKELKDRIISGDGRWMIRKPDNYRGKAYIGDRYIYEHRYIIEQELGRLLKSDEIVHHIDGNKLNNDRKNLELKNKIEHDRQHSTTGKTMITLVCAYCGKNFQKEKRQTYGKIKNNQKDFYCNRSCMAKHFGRGRSKNIAGIA